MGEIGVVRNGQSRVGDQIKTCIWTAVDLLGSTAAPAQVSTDLAKITCNEFILFKVTDPTNIALWLSGRYSAKRNNNYYRPAGGFRSSFSKARDASGIVGMTFNDLRGTAVTRLALASCTEPETATANRPSTRSGSLSSGYSKKGP
jgi:hypothetical protein